VVNNRNKIRELSDESKKNLLSSIEKDPASPLKKYEAALHNKDFNVFYNAPVWCTSSGPSGSVHSGSIVPWPPLTSCFRRRPGVGNLLGGPGFADQKPETLKELGLPEEFQIVAPMALGIRIPSRPS